MGHVILCTCTHGNALPIFSFGMSEVLTFAGSWPEKAFYLIFGCFVHSNILTVFDLSMLCKESHCLPPTFVDVEQFRLFEVRCLFCARSSGQMR